VAGFKTHITVSTSLGVAYGAAGNYFAGMPPGVCLLAGGLCSVSGMLPDLDSDSGVPLRESLAFAAAVVPMLMIPRGRTLELTPELMVLAGSAVYLAIRFGLGWLLKKYTVHRGMFHSLPAALIATELAFLVYSRKDINLRYFVALSVAAGFMSHLILDEIWSIGVKRGQIAIKKSFGTAMKLWGDNLWANFSCYGKLVALSYFVLHDPVWMYDSTPPSENIRLIAQKLIDRVRGTATASSDDEMPPLRAIPRSGYDERRDIRIEEPRPSDDRRARNDRNDPFWQDREREEYVEPQPRLRDQRYEDDRWLYQR
jgi:membrane-bound metal-dependent hydrolase YbcI (DUF457 family)